MRALTRLPVLLSAGHRELDPQLLGLLSCLLLQSLHWQLH